MAQPCRIGDATRIQLRQRERDDLVGPGYTDVDISAYKNFPFLESRSVQFRAEFFNCSTTPTMQSRTLPSNLEPLDSSPLRSARVAKSSSLSRWSSLVPRPPWLPRRPGTYSWLLICFFLSAYANEIKSGTPLRWIFLFVAGTRLSEQQQSSQNNTIFRIGTFDRSSAEFLQEAPAIR